MSQPVAPAAPRPASPPPPAGAAGPDWWLFMRAFFRKGRSIASVAPSSRFMARRMLAGIDFDAANCIVELGAGTGPVTAELAPRVRPHTKLVVIELDPLLCARLRSRFPHLDVIQGDACRLDEYLAERGIAQVDHVCSGLPLPSFPADLRDRVLATSSRVLSPAGTFRQLTVMPMVYYQLYRRYFDDVRFNFVPANLPPGGVYVCRGYRPQGS
jgi:phospholipid N-methyltransferase